MATLNHPSNNAQSTAFFIITLLLFVARTHAGITVSDTHISTTRNALRSKVCNYYSANYTSSEISQSQSYINQYTYMSNTDVETILFDNNFTQFKTNTILIVAPHLVAFFIFAIIWIPLICCCVWPQKHPVCRKCRKPQKEMYGKCELKWTAYISVICYLAIMAGGILGIIQGSNIINAFNDVGCKTAALGDDILYGRLSPSVENRFFTGIAPLSTDLVSYNSSFNTIWTQNSNSLGNANNVASKQSLFQLFTSSIYSYYTNPTYSTAFSTDGTTYVNVDSQFKTMYYGPTTNSTTILGNIYSVSQVIFNQINSVLNPMIAAYNNLTATGQAGVQSQINATIITINAFTVNLNSFINNWSALFNNSSLFQQMTLILKAFYGLFFGLALIGALGATILACFSVVKVRMLMYFACVFLFIIGFVSFALLIGMSAIAPNLSQICSYMDSKLTTGAGTSALFTKLGFSQLGDFMSNCMTDGNGWVMDKISPTFNTSFSDLLLISKSAQLFSSLIPGYSSANLVAPFTSASITVNKVLNAQLLDLNDSISLTHITKVQGITYPLSVNCDVTAVNADSWMPSYDIYTCSGGKAQNPPCLNLSTPSTCPYGCYEIMKEFISSSGDNSFTTTLATRYGGATCNYYLYIKNLHNNWNLPRNSNMNIVLANLSTLQSKITDYDTTFKGTQANISTYSTILQTNFNGLTNLTSGTFNGLDCRVIGQSLIDMRNSICVGMVNSVYFNLICLILVSYGTLLAACCTVCAGVRHFRHLQKMQIHVGYKGVPVSITDTSKILEK